jgi:hypothetical protein
MIKPSVFVSVAFASPVLFCSLTACGSAPTSESTGRSGQAATIAPQANVDPAFTGCVTDDDCVAIPQAGCCDNGWLVAVNSCSVADYTAANACQTSSPICPMYIVNDTRVAVCDPSSNACTLVQPTAASTDDAGAPASNDGAGEDAGTSTTQF